MMFLEAECPHCAEKRGFEVFAASDFTADRPLKAIKKDQTTEPCWINKNMIPDARFFAAGVCVYCHNPILVELELSDAYLDAIRECITSGKRYTGQKPVITRAWPQPVPPYSHPALPEKVRELFTDMQTMQKQNLAPSLIVTGCRSVLEEAVRELGGQGKTLHERISNLNTKAVVNGVLHEWAIAIKNLGNEAVHELSGDKKTADELVEFTKLFLQYTFEFPARIQEIRKPQRTAPEPKKKS